MDEINLDPYLATDTKYGENDLVSRIERGVYENYQRLVFKLQPINERLKSCAGLVDKIVESLMPLTNIDKDIFIESDQFHNDLVELHKKRENIEESITSVLELLSMYKITDHDKDILENSMSIDHIFLQSLTRVCGMKDFVESSQSNQYPALKSELAENVTYLLKKSFRKVMDRLCECMNFQSDSKLPPYQYLCSDPVSSKLFSLFRYCPENILKLLEHYCISGSKYASYEFSILHHAIFSHDRNFSDRDICLDISHTLNIVETLCIREWKRMDVIFGSLSHFKPDNNTFSTFINKLIEPVTKNFCRIASSVIHNENSRPGNVNDKYLSLLHCHHLIVSTEETIKKNCLTMSPENWEIVKSLKNFAQEFKDLATRNLDIFTADSALYAITQAEENFFTTPNSLVVSIHIINRCCEFSRFLPDYSQKYASVANSLINEVIFPRLQLSVSALLPYKLEIFMLKFLVALIHRIPLAGSTHSHFESLREILSAHYETYFESFASRCMREISAEVGLEEIYKLVFAESNEEDSKQKNVHKVRNSLNQFYSNIKIMSSIPFAERAFADDSFGFSQETMARLLKMIDENLKGIYAQIYNRLSEDASMKVILRSLSTVTDEFSRILNRYYNMGHNNL